GASPYSCCRVRRERRGRHKFSRACAHLRELWGELSGSASARKPLGYRDLPSTVGLVGCRVRRETKRMARARTDRAGRRAAGAHGGGCGVTGDFYVDARLPPVEADDVLQLM